MTESSRPVASAARVYDQETFFKISELPICNVCPDFLSTEFCSEFDGPDGTVRLWCPNRWIQNIWHQEEADRLKHKNPKSAAINIPDGDGRRETLERLKSESDDGIVLSPQRRSFGAGCQVGLSRSSKDNIRDTARHVTNSRSRNNGRSHRYDNWRDHSATTSSGRSGGKEFPTKQRNSGPNAWSFQRNEKKGGGGGGASSASKEKMPEWMTNGPKDMFDTVELHGFDDEDESPKSQRSDRPSVDPMTNGIHGAPFESKSSDADFHAETDAILNRFLGLSTDGQGGQSRFCQFFEQAVGSTTKNEDRKSVDNDVEPDQTERRSTQLQQSGHSIGSLPGALRLEDIESSAATLSADTVVQTTAAVQGLFESFKYAPNQRDDDGPQHVGLLRRNAFPATQTQPPVDEKWPPAENEPDTFHPDNVLSTFGGAMTADHRCPPAAMPHMGGPQLQQSMVGWKSPMGVHHPSLAFHGTHPDSSLYGPRVAPAAVAPPSPFRGSFVDMRESPLLASDRTVLPSTVHLSHQRNIPLDVINAMIEMKDSGTSNAITEYMAAVGFQSREMGPTSSSKMYHPEHNLQKPSNMMPTSVLRQMHHDKMSGVQMGAAGSLDQQNETSAAEAAPTFAAVAASGTKNNGTMTPLGPLKMPPWGYSSGRSPQISPQEGVWIAGQQQQQRLVQDNWRMPPGFVQHAAGYPIVRSSGVPPQCLPVAMQMLRARMFDAAHAQRMMVQNTAALRMANGPPRPPPPPPPQTSAPFESHHAAMLMQHQQQLAQQYRMPQSSPYYSSAYTEAGRNAGTIAVKNLFKMVNMASAVPLPLDGKALTLEEIENQVKTSRSLGP